MPTIMYTLDRYGFTVENYEKEGRGSTPYPPELTKIRDVYEAYMDLSWKTWNGSPLIHVDNEDNSENPMLVYQT